MNMNMNMSMARVAQVHGGVRATVTRDCALRLRITYHLPRAVDLAELDALVEVGGGAVQIDAFSTFVAGALDHFKFPVSRYSLANGAVGGQELVLTYGRLGAGADPKDRGWVEACLAELYGPIRGARGELTTPASHNSNAPEGLRATG